MENYIQGDGPSVELIDAGRIVDTNQIAAFTDMLFRHVDWSGEVVSLLGIGEKGTPAEGVFKQRRFMAGPSADQEIGPIAEGWAGQSAACFIVPAVVRPGAVIAGDVKLDKIAALTAIILDLDSGDVAAKRAWAVTVLGEPTMTVASGGRTPDGQDKLHLYWRLSEPADEVERVAALRKLLAAKCGGDQSFGRATQIIRVPGTVHGKDGVASLCRIIGQAEAEIHFSDAVEAVDGAVPMSGLPVAAQGPTPSLMLAGGMMDFSGGAGAEPGRAVDALHRDVHAGGDDMTRWSEFSKVCGFHIAEVRAGRYTAPQAVEAAYGWMLTHMVPPWPRARFEAEFQGLVKRDIANHGPFPQAVAKTNEVTATPFSWPEANTIPPRPWVFGRWLLRNTVTTVVAPGGVGKSSLMASIVLSLVSGQPILGREVFGGPLRAWYWNLEDDGEELARLVTAARILHGVIPADCGDRLYVDSGPDGAVLCTATDGGSGFKLVKPVFEAIIAELRRRKIDVLIVDPFVSSHQIDENSNSHIDAIAKEWAHVAKAARCSIVLVHHSKKMGGQKVTAEASRGASALTNAARSVLALNPMDDAQGNDFGIDPVDRRRYFTVQDDKHNRAPPERSSWFQLKSVELPCGDSIGVVAPWKPTRATDGITQEQLVEVQRIIAEGDWRQNQQARDWAGIGVAGLLGLDLSNRENKSRVNALLKHWIKNGLLAVELRQDNSRKDRPFVVVGPLKASAPGSPMNFNPIGGTFDQSIWESEPTDPA